MSIATIQTIFSSDTQSLQTIIDTIPVSVLVIDQEGVFIDCNKATLQIFQASSRDDIIGKKPADLSPEKQSSGNLSSNASEKLIKRAYEDGSMTFFYDLITLHGDLFPARVTLDSLKYEGKSSLMCTITDMRGQVRVEKNEALINQNPYIP